MKHDRRCHRLPGWDYASSAFYFATICTHQRLPLLSRIIQGDVHLTEFGKIVDQEWLRSPMMRSELALDVYVIMPNHIHGIVCIGEGDASQAVGATGRSPMLRPVGPAPGSLGAFVGGFKSRASKRINLHRNAPGTPVWQRGFYDHVIRNLESLTRLRRYIVNNPLKWHLDRYRTVAGDGDSSP